jgi:transitional endoplasmic reticulum ATPase
MAPTIIYFDEIEALSSGRGISQGNPVHDSVITQILTEMDGIENRNGVIVIATTNRPDLVDPAFLRPGRIDKLIYIEAPDYESRLSILEVHTKSMPLAQDVSLKNIALITEGYSGADLENLCREAGMQALRETKKNFKEVNAKHFEIALNKVGSTLPKDTLERYDTISKSLAQAQKMRDSESGLYK